MRMVCLDRRRKDLGALASLLTEADGKVVEKAVDAASALPSLQPCQDIATLAEQPGASVGSGEEDGRGAARRPRGRGEGAP